MFCSFSTKEYLIQLEITDANRKSAFWKINEIKCSQNYKSLSKKEKVYKHLANYVFFHFLKYFCCIEVWNVANFCRIVLFSFSSLLIFLTSKLLRGARAKQLIHRNYTIGRSVLLILNWERKLTVKKLQLFQK